MKGVGCLIFCLISPITWGLLIQEKEQVESRAQNGCCSEVKLYSTGFAENYQASRMGTYNNIGQAGGRALFQQSGGNNFLFYLPEKSIWMVGPDVGKDYGGILNRESGECPSQLNRDWEYWSDWSESWESDMMFEAKCAGGPGPDPDTTPSPVHEPCTWGDVCYSCNIWSEVNGVRYCCANDCNSGGIWAGSENGQVNCYCYH